MERRRLSIREIQVEMAGWLATSINGWQEFFGDYSHTQTLYPPITILFSSFFPGVGRECRHRSQCFEILCSLTLWSNCIVQDFTEGEGLSACSPHIENLSQYFEPCAPPSPSLFPLGRLIPTMRDLNFFTSWNLNEATLRKLSEKLQLTHYFRWRMWIFWWTIALSLNSKLQRLLICFQQLLVCCSVFFNHAGHWLLYAAAVMASLDPGWYKQRIYLLRRKVLYQLASTRKQTRLALQHEFVTPPDLEASAIFPFSVYTND